MKAQFCPSSLSCQDPFLLLSAVGVLYGAGKLGLHGEVHGWLCRRLGSLREAEGLRWLSYAAFCTVELILVRRDFILKETCESRKQHVDVCEHLIWCGRKRLVGCIKEKQGENAEGQIRSWSEKPASSWREGPEGISFGSSSK